MAALSGLIRVMERAARRAGGRLRRDFGEIEHLQVSRKGPADFVSKADRMAERALYDDLLQARPGWGFVLEEAGTIEGEADKPRWIIDPLDGTSNFLHGIPHFAISIAVQEPRLDGKGWGDVIAAVVYQPITDETFWAEKTRGAWLHDGRLRVSSRNRLSEALIATGMPFQGHGDFAEWARIYGAIGPEVAGIRRYGAASLDLAWLAAGRFDGFWESGLNDWDTAAGCLLVREAGGFVTDYRGRSEPVHAKQVLAGNDRLHSKMHKLLANSLK
ncbi:inositol monophosphatase family protein [Alteriqipengyuania flavescens]|uniref:inositol monophosphatase family protein n=1 Tax=Alteriqipengyuania flavescens TaxID=3053610 RepID=UPI0025B43806|nr:inositol monophosphatase family protein [Alteriqipengyuania flavescens]WJY18418.1 inositol monophosphatase family protein [Alteriqipengyuania flavescens]WJY24359.1 inositol monophosphatase family protein [Alteriqipengyuania flavescens]